MKQDNGTDEKGARKYEQPELNRLIETLMKNNGNITDSAKALKCDRNTIYKMIESNPALKQIINRAREVIIDEAEKYLLDNIKEGNVTSIIFVLKTLGRSRGYVLNGYKPNEVASKINHTVLKKLTDEQLNELETIFRKKKDIKSFLAEIGLDASSD